MSTDGRDETHDERADRNWNEVLQELRVMQTGTQILTGFLLALAFQPTFADLSSDVRAFYLVLVVLAAVSAIVALAPVAVHRVLFRRRVKQEVVFVGHVCLIIALTTVSVLLLGVVAFVFDVVLGGGSLVWVVVPLGALLIALWAVIPAIIRVRPRRREQE